MPILLLIGAIAAGAVFAAHRANASTQSGARWMPSTGYVRPGQRYRWSLDAMAPTTKGDALAGLANIGWPGATMWMETEAPPADWPADDRGPNRRRIEGTFNGPPTQLPPTSGFRIYEWRIA